VSFPFGNGTVSGNIIEDRGSIGIGGRRHYGIRFAAVVHYLPSRAPRMVCFGT
jgi:hypothetical protein